MDIMKEMERIFRDVFDNEVITLTNDTTSKDIEGWDSLAQIRLLIAMEKQFKIRFNATDVGKMENVGDMARYIQHNIS